LCTEIKHCPTFGEKFYLSFVLGKNSVCFCSHRKT
jgi:hypothetical protein